MLATKEMIKKRIAPNIPMKLRITFGNMYNGVF